jgi:hypothetical protein
LKIFYLNIEGISVSKSDYLNRLMREHDIKFESSEERPTTWIQTDWCYLQQRSWQRNVRQRYFDGYAPSFVGGSRLFEDFRR